MFSQGCFLYFCRIRLTVKVTVMMMMYLNYQHMPLQLCRNFIVKRNEDKNKKLQKKAQT